ncbi:Uncharacterised protein [Mycolicibacterium phlei]|nr:Uncharacterised protein [Mycolicibacterium phlei]
MTTGPTNVFGAALNPLQLFAVLPDLARLLFDAIKFVTTGAHGKYGDPAYALWDGMTAVDHAVATIRRVAPGGCILFLFPGTWANWNQGFRSTSPLGCSRRGVASRRPRRSGLVPIEGLCRSGVLPR